METLRTFALAFPEADEGIACQGTQLETRTVRVRQKAFLFLGESNVRLKLRSSLPEAEALASKEPGRFAVGSHGWVTVKSGEGMPSIPGLLERWIDESYRLFAPSRLVASLPKRDDGAE